MFRALGWNSISAFVSIVLGVIQLPLLTLFVDRSEFAGIGISLSIFSIFQILSDGGMLAEVVREKNLTTEKFSDICERSLIISVIVSFACLISAGALIFFGKNKEVGLALCFYAGVVFIGGMVIPIRGLLIKKEIFKYLSIIEILYCVTQFAASIFFASIGWGALSISFGAFFAVIGQFFLANIVRKKFFNEFNVSKKINIKNINLKNNKNSMSIAVGEVFAAISGQVDVIISGLIFNSSDIGFYVFSKNICMKLQFLITPAVNKIVLSRLADKLNSGASASGVFISATKIVFLSNALIFCTLFFAADFFVKNFLGDKWVGVDKVIRMMCVWALMRCFYTPIGSFFSIMNRGHDLIRFNIFVLFLLSSATFSAFFLGVYFLPALCTFSYFIVAPFYLHFVVNKIFSVSVINIFKLFFPMLSLIIFLSWLCFFWR